MNKYILHKELLTNKELDFVRAEFGTNADNKGCFYSLQTANDIELPLLREQLGCDVSKLSEQFNGEQVRLLVTDMDSTLISIECIDEIADMLGIKPQVSAITEAAMRGELDFEESLTQRVALLKGLPIDKLQRVYDERLKLNPGAEG
jgi:phosphoserine phosphatase